MNQSIDPLTIIITINYLPHRAAHECSAGAAPSDPVAVVVCPVCARGIRLGAGQDANAAFEAHSVSPQCDPSNYARVMKKRKCPVKVKTFGFWEKDCF